MRLSATRTSAIRHSSARSLEQQIAAILRRWYAYSPIGKTTVSLNTATSTGPITIADGGTVEVLDNKIWKIV